MWQPVYSVSPALISYPLIEAHAMELFLGGIKWISKLYRNQGNLLFASPPMDWDEQIVVVTGGKCCYQILCVK